MIKFYNSVRFVLRKHIIIGGCILILSLGGSMAQNIVLCSGSNLMASNGSISYSVGQVAFENISEGSAQVEEGVQHAYEIYITGVNDNSSLSLELIAYPNPTNNFINLETNISLHDKMHYQLHDIYGKNIEEGIIMQRHTQIDLFQYQTTLFYLKVYDEQTLFKTFIILKQ